uniref:EF-hand domain-containing protein n=1 Tax=Davidia involucrata TaxID=16924 RepID=A0A5B6YUC8_DAVIN
MGQILDKFQGKEWRQNQLRKITDSVFDNFKKETGSANLSFEDLYISVLFVYNDINKRLPGAHLDPPSKEQVRTMMQDCDVNLDGELDREEFVRFILQLTKDAFITVGQKLIITLVVAPIVALLTKRAAEGIPGVGNVVHRLPNSVHASVVTLAAVMFQNSG